MKSNSTKCQKNSENGTKFQSNYSNSSRYFKCSSFFSLGYCSAFVFFIVVGIILQTLIQRNVDMHDQINFLDEVVEAANVEIQSLMTEKNTYLEENNELKNTNKILEDEIDA